MGKIFFNEVPDDTVVDEDDNEEGDVDVATFVFLALGFFRLLVVIFIVATVVRASKSRCVGCQEVCVDSEVGPKRDKKSDYQRRLYFCLFLSGVTSWIGSFGSRP